MTAITSGTYYEPRFQRAIHSIVSSLMSRIATPPLRRATPVRDLVREANEVRNLARSVERESPGFASDLYAAAERHELLGSPDPR